ncbi:hypothetical protein C8J56DRAFT_1118360 [Mycena floridula]|nr:hypothetical protein C8J56DRAFT_1118360 [Mycena floridula]
MSTNMTPFLAPAEYCTGKENWFEYEANFLQATGARGWIQYLNGSFTEPPNEPTDNTVTTIRDPTTNVITGISTVSKPIHVTALGSDKPTIAEYRQRERFLNYNIKLTIPDAQSYGYDASKHAAVNWAAVKAHLGKVSVIEQDQARKALASKQLFPRYEDPKEYDNHVNSWHVLRRRALAFGVKYEDSLLKTLFILSITGDDFILLGGGLPDTDTVFEAIEKLKAVWLLKYSKRVEEMAEQNRVTAMTASINAAAASKSRSKGKGAPAGGVGPCTNHIVSLLVEEMKVGASPIGELPKRQPQLL